MLYHEAASLITVDDDKKSSLKSRVYASKDLKSPAKQVYALLVEASRWSAVLSPIITNIGLLDAESKVKFAISCAVWNGTDLMQ